VIYYEFLRQDLRQAAHSSSHVTFVAPRLLSPRDFRPSSLWDFRLADTLSYCRRYRTADTIVLLRFIFVLLGLSSLYDIFLALRYFGPTKTFVLSKLLFCKYFRPTEFFRLTSPFVLSRKASDR